MPVGNYIFAAERRDLKASAGTLPAGKVVRAGPSGERGDGDERALGQVPYLNILKQGRAAICATANFDSWPSPVSRAALKTTGLATEK
jgi:hypothetical protein